MERKKWISLAVFTCLLLAVQLCVSLYYRGPSLSGLRVHPNPALTTGSEVLETLLLIIATFVFVVLAVRHSRNQRWFWAMMACGVGLWAITWSFWVWYEVVMHTEVPTPSLADYFLFMHLVPFMGALLALPHLNKSEGPRALLDFLMLASWWGFLYLFAVGPWQFADIDPDQYNFAFDQLYIMANVVLLIGAFAVWARCRNNWKNIYGALFIIHMFYAMISFVINQFIDNKDFTPGDPLQILYDIPAASLVLIGVYAMLHPAESSDDIGEQIDSDRPWMARISLLVLLALPVMAFLASRRGAFPYAVEHFKLYVIAIAQFILTIIVFYRLFLLNRVLSRLLGESREAYDAQQLLQEQLIQSEKMAAIGRLAAGAAHEINNPLTVIFGYSEILSNDAASTPEVRDMADKIHQQARRTRDVVSQLMMFAKPSVGPHILVDINVVVENAVKMRRLDTEREVFDLVLTKADPIAKVKASENQMLQVCIHLINNAVDAMRNQPPPHTLKIITAQLQDSIEISFEDSGPGVKHPERIFDPFYTTKEIGQGIGLGLSAVFGIIREHNGTITCVNNPERGARFTIQIPVPKENDVSATKQTG